jgi:iron complex outermembrane receptor protein
VKVIANALWNIGKFSVNLRETIYGSTGQHISTSGSGNCATGNTATCMLLKTPTTFITDLNVGYLTRSLRIDVGANNLFDHGAKTLPTVYTGTAYRPLNGNVYASPASFTPWGINGGYYGRVTFTF